MQIFISYAREDYQSAKKLFESLRRIPGITPWLDKESLLPGMDWEYGIMAALEESNFIVLLLSKNSVSKSGFVQREVKESLKRLTTFPSGSIFIIPARLEDCTPQDSQLNKLQWVDLFSDWSEGIAKITQAIEYQNTGKRKRTKESISSVVNVLESEYVSDYERLSQHAVRGCLKRNRSLAGLNMMNLDLRAFDFSGTDLQGANLVAANLSDSIISGTNLKGANLERASLVNADIREANLWGANLWHANLMGIDNIEYVETLQYTNFYGVSGLNEKQRSIAQRQTIVNLADYGSFLEFFRFTVGMSANEIERIFVWVNHEYFRSMLGRVL